FFQAEDGIRDRNVTGVQTCALPIFLAAPLAALVAMVTSGMPLLATYTDIFMPAMAGFVGSYFPIFLTGAIFGALMLFSGYATDRSDERRVGEEWRSWLKTE